MADKTSVFKLGAGTYQIDFEGTEIRFYHISKTRGHRPIGKAHFTMHKDTANLSGGIMHNSPRIVSELAEIAERIFRERHPGIAIRGHALWLHRRKPPVGFFLHGEKPVFPKRHRQRPKTRRH